MDIVILERRVTERRISKFALIDIVDFVSQFLETFLFEFLRFAQDDRYAVCSLANGNFLKPPALSKTQQATVQTAETG